MNDICEKTGLLSHAIPVPGGESYNACTNRAAKFFQVTLKIININFPHYYQAHS